MDTSDEHAKRRAKLNALIERECGGNASAFARKYDLNDRRIHQMLNANYREGRSFGHAAAREVERKVGLPHLYFDVDIVDAGQEAPKSTDVAAVKNVQHRNQLSLPQDKGNVIAWSEEDELPEDPERVWVSRYDYYFSAGDGVLQWEIREKRALPFNSSFFRAKRVRPENCKLLVARGDSMEPYLFDRDVFMIDHSDQRVRDGEIYAIHFEDEALVKQLFKLPGGGLTLHSYNNKYPDRQIEPSMMESIQIVGRVIYRSG